MYIECLLLLQSSSTEPGATTPGSPNDKPLPPVPEGENAEYMEVTEGELEFLYKFTCT